MLTDLNRLTLPELFAELSHGGLVNRLLELARDEDLGEKWEQGDVTSRSFVPGYVRGTARAVVRQGGVVCGLACIEPILHVFRADVDAKLLVKDGVRVEAGQAVAELAGSMRAILGIERTMLNLLGRLSGIATRTARFVEAAREAGGDRVVILDTRKTTPGLRSLEKYAVRCGGGHCHRLGLYDAVLIKDNHIAGLAGATGSPGAAGKLPDEVRHAVKVATAEAGRDGLRFIELEVDTLEQLKLVLDAGGCGVQIVLLDNMDGPTLKQAVAMRDAGQTRVLLEASGGVSLETVGAIAATGVDRISVGSLTHGAVSLDVGLDVAAG